MASLNKVLLIGNLTRDPDLRYTAAGTAVANLRLAVNRTFVVQGDKREETLFIDVVAWAKQAEACAEYLAKGSAILVDGRLQSREYEAKDGGKRTVVGVVADTVQFLTRRPGAPTAAGAGAEVPAETAAGADDEVPF
jgi:single-strand DNA-binding protein